MRPVRTTSVCVSSLKTGGLHTARCVSNSGFPFLIGYVISVRDTEEFAETSHLQCLCPSSMSAAMVHVSHAYQSMNMARERISLILELIVMFLLFQITFSLVTAAMVCAVLDSTSGLDPSSDTIAPRYLKLRTVSSFLLSMVMSVLMPSAGSSLH